MGVIIKDIRQVRSVINNDTGKVKDLWAAMRERVEKNTRHLGLLQPEDTQEWWHLIWERVSDAAFVQAVEPSERLKEWLRCVTLDVCSKPIDEWIGPWFRPRSNPPIGMLETSHIAVAVATVIDLCTDMFSSSELVEIRASLKTKGQEPCRNYILKILNGKDNINNWYMVLLNGFGTASAILGDDAAVKESLGYYKYAAAQYNRDSHGESVQYSNYASIHLSHLYEILIRYNPELEDRIDMECYTRLMPWYAASFMYMKPLEGWGDDEYPRAVNFGDSSVMFRPSGDVLMSIAARAGKSFPREAGLARWLFEETYANTRLEPTERASFGFFNTFQFFSILMYNDAVEAISPEAAGLPLLSVFELGNIIARDGWKEPITVLGIQGGFIQHNVTAHRHGDQNSFMLSHLKERFFVDPGHCCYRLKTHAFTKSTQSHNTWSFEAIEDGKPVLIEQKDVKGNIFNKTPHINKLGVAKEIDGIHVVSSDAGEIYGDPVKKAERVWIAPMPNTLFIIDRIEASKPVKVQSHFVINNRDNKLRTNVAAETKLVFRRSPAAMKFFQVSSKSDGAENKCKLSFAWGAVHDCYHPLPNQKGQGAEGSSYIYNYTSEEYKTNHTIVYAAAMDHIDRIKGWHIKTLDENSFYVEPPEKTGGYSIELLEDGAVNIKDHSSSREYRYTGSDFIKI